MFSKSKQASAPEKRRRAERPSTAGAHELFLEYEGFLPAVHPRPRKPPAPTTRLAQAQPPALHHEPRIKTSQDTMTGSKMSWDQPLERLSDLHDKSNESHPHPKRFPSRRKNGFFSLKRSGRDDREDPSQNYSKTSPLYTPDQESGGYSAPRGWLQRCISTASRSHLSPPPSFTTIPPYSGSPITEDSDITALPALPGYESESLKREENSPSGSAARAAVAAQNEVLDSLRNLRLAEPKLTGDSESGVGIEVRDREEPVVNVDVPVIRKDPLSALPEELVGHILSYLDAVSLINAEFVSHNWYQSASSQHVWRQIFHAEFQDVCQTVAVPIAGRPGLGRRGACQDWKKKWRVRKALEQRWKDSHAAAIYLEGHKDSVYCAQFDEEKILTGSRDRTVRIWDAKTYECIKVLGVASRGAGSATPPLPADMATRGHRPFTKIFSPPSKVAPSVVPNDVYHTGSILCLQYDDNIMITGSSDSSLIVWDVKANYKPIMRLRRHKAGVLDVCFDEKHIVSCSKDSTVCLWDRNTGAFLRKMTGHRGPVNAVQLRGDLVVSASGDGLARLWNIRSGLCIKEFPSRDRGLACVEFSPDSRTILAGGNDQVIYQFDTSTGEQVREMKGHEGLVRSLHLDSASGRVVSGSYDTSVKVYDLRSGEAIVNFTKWTSSWILSAKADYRRIVATSQDSRAVIMDFGYQLPGIELLEA